MSFPRNHPGTSRIYDGSMGSRFIPHTSAESRYRRSLGRHRPSLGGQQLSPMAAATVGSLPCRPADYAQALAHLSRLNSANHSLVARITMRACMLRSSVTQPFPQVYPAAIKISAVLIRRKRWSEDLLTSFFRLPQHSAGRSPFSVSIAIPSAPSIAVF